MFDKLAAIERQYDELLRLARLGRGAERSGRVPEAREGAVGDRDDSSSASASTRPSTRDIAQTEELAAGTDPDMRELAQEELKALVARREALVADLKVLLVPKDPNDEKNVVLEIRAGTGGDEAALFAAELFRMYSQVRRASGLADRGDVDRATPASAA